MYPLKGLGAACLWLLLALPAAARELPPVIHGDAAVQMNAFGAVFEVASDLVQVRLNSSLVATAAKGAAFEIYPPLLGGSSEMLHVTRGSVVLIDERSDRAATIAAGGRLTYAAAVAPSVQPEIVADLATPAEAHAIAPPAELEDATTRWQLQEGRQGFLLSDSVMTRQQEYLSSLKIDIVDLNRILASFIRRLLF